MTTSVATFGPYTPATLVTDYATMSTADKSTARTYAETMMRDSIDRAIAGDSTAIEDAGSWKTARESLVSAPVKTAPDHAATVSVLAASLIDAAHRLATTGVVIDGTTYRATLDTESDPAIVARVSVVTTRKATRGGVVAYIESVVTDEPTKIAGLRARWTASTNYPKSAPSAGAIGAAFDRIEAGAEASFVVVDVNGHRGAVSA